MGLPLIPAISPGPCLEASAFSLPLSCNDAKRVSMPSFAAAT